MRELDKERRRRFETANGLARDVERFLNDETVMASPPSSSNRLRKLIRKHSIAINTFGAFVALLLPGVVVRSDPGCTDVSDGTQRGPKEAPLGSSILLPRVHDHSSKRCER